MKPLGWRGRLILLLGLLLALPLVGASTTETRVIQLQHQQAETVIPLLEPHLDKARVSGRHFQLLLRGPGAELDGVEQLLRELDQPARSVTLTLRFEEGPPRETVRDETTVRRLATGRTSREQRVLARDGSEVMLRLHQALPREERRIFLSPHAVLLEDRTYYLNVQQTLLARPLLHGENQVTVELSALSQRLDSADEGRVLSREWSGRLTGTLGDWILLGETRADRDTGPETRATGRVFRTRPRAAEELRIWLRVDLAN